jgi:ribokinase
MVRVLCAGHVNWDVTLRVPALPAPDAETVITDRARAGGGSAANTAVALAGLGVESSLLGSVGTDNQGRLARQELTGAGVDTTHLQRVAGETTVKYLVVDESGEVLVFANDGVNERFGAEDLPPAALSAVDHLHLTGQRVETAVALAERARRAAVSLSVDPGRRLGDRDYRQVATLADYLFVNDREAVAAAESGLTDAVDGSIVVTDGADGGEIRGPDPVTHDGYDVDVTDTTGAGDAFAAGFLTTVLHGGSREEALAVANACGALAAETVGARADLSWAAVDALRE